jgi:hypothetical protein
VIALIALVWRDNGVRVTYASASLLTAVAVLMTSKVLSPQYLVWILALVAITVDARPSESRRRQWQLAIVALAVASFTQVLYPWWFARLVLVGGTGVMSVLSVRLLLLLVLTGLVFRWAFTPEQGGIHPRIAQSELPASPPEAPAEPTPGVLVADR